MKKTVRSWPDSGQESIPAVYQALEKEETLEAEDRPTAYLCLLILRDPRHFSLD